MQYLNGKKSFLFNSASVNITLFDAMDIMTIIPTVSCRTGSTWRKIGIPPYGGSFGGLHGNCARGPQFTDHAPSGYYGYGSVPGGGNSPDLEANPNWKVVDELKVPEGLMRYAGFD
jgi:hypothetical protein